MGPTRERPTSGLALLLSRLYSTVWRFCLREKGQIQHVYAEENVSMKSYPSTAQQKKSTALGLQPEKGEA